VDEFQAGPDLRRRSHRPGARARNAVPEQDPDAIVHFVREGEIEVAVSVDITGGNGPGGFEAAGRDGEGRKPPAPSLRRAKALLTEVRHDEIGESPFPSPTTIWAGRNSP
jgi:hypothetical protein